MITIGEGCAIVSGLLSAATFISVRWKEASSTKRQVELLLTIGELRKEISENYLSQQVWTVERERIWDRLGDYKRARTP